VAFERVPKPGGGRLLCRLDAELATRYTSAVVGVAADVERALAPEVLAHRVVAVSRRPPAIVLRDWRRERGCFESERARILGLVVTTDVAECYGSISLDAVREALHRCGVGSAGTLACVRVLEELAAEGVPGLPIGPIPSAVLANAVLAVGDGALRRLQVTFLRWVDDWWIGVRSAPHAAEALGLLGAALATAGLRLNDDKTRVTRPDDAGCATSGGEYHRAAHAHAVPILARANALVPRDRGLVACRRAARGAGGER
jgi:hypothetical protein